MKRGQGVAVVPCPVHRASLGGVAPLATLTFLLPVAGHHLLDGGRRTQHAVAPKFLFFPLHPEQKAWHRPLFTTAKETVPPEKDVKQQLRQEGIFPSLCS